MDLGIIVDLETTGLDANSDEIIEIGIMSFSMEEQGEPNIVNLYSGLQQPTLPLSPEIVKLTGLTDSVLEGQKIDWDFVRNLFQNCEIAIAHNAAFDSSFLKNSGELEGISCHWGCSARHIDWKKHGFRTRALNYLAADHGFVNPFAHRAVFDCATTFRLITPYISELVTKSYEKEVRVEARESPFETKDILRGRGYRWNPEARFWFKDVFESDLEEERNFLETEIYPGVDKHVEEELPSLQWN